MVNEITHNKNSYFDGDLIQLIGHGLLCAIITFATFGICFPWAICIMCEWEAKHTVIDGKRLYFNGTARDLFKTWIKWLLLIIITFGIYTFFVQIKVKHWIIEYTHFED